jgi:methionyl-tRNA synthetase
VVKESHNVGHDGRAALLPLRLLVSPFMPNAPARIFEQIGLQVAAPSGWESAKIFGLLNKDVRVTKGPALFPRIDTAAEKI